MTSPPAARPAGATRDRGTPVSVVILDDHDVVRLGLRSAIGHAGGPLGLRVVATVTTVADLYAVLGRTPCQVVVLDLALGDRSDPADTVRALVGAGYRVLIYSIADNPRLVRRAVAAGAHGLSRKSEPVLETVRKIGLVADGETLVQPETMALIDGDAEFVEARLSAREREVLILYVSGYEVAQIAVQLFVTENSAKEYLRRIRAKYGEARRPAPSKVDLLRRAIEDGLVPPIQPRG